MTTEEIIWLAEILPRTAIAEIQAEAEQSSDFWSGIPIPRCSAIAARVVAIELALIRRGGLEMLDRESI